MKYVACALLSYLSGGEPDREKMEAIFDSVGIEYDVERIESLLSALEDGGGLRESLTRGLHKLETAEWRERGGECIRGDVDFLPCGCKEEWGYHECTISLDSTDSDDDFPIDIFG